MLQNIAMLAIGAVLVCLGVVAGAIADRIRSQREGDATPATPRALTKSGRGSLARERSVATSASVPVPMLTDVRDALVGLGYKPAVATAAAAEARRKLGDGAPLAVWIREALQCCPAVTARA